MMYDDDDILCEINPRNGIMTIFPPPPRPPEKKKPNSSVSGGVLFGCSLAVLVVLVFCFGCLVLHCLCPKWLAMAAMWAMTPGSSGNRPSSLC